MYSLQTFTDICVSINKCKINLVLLALNDTHMEELALY